MSIDMFAGRNIDFPLSVLQALLSSLGDVLRSLPEVRALASWVSFILMLSPNLS